jgi:hypothetical protein
MYGFLSFSPGVNATFVIASERIALILTDPEGPSSDSGFAQEIAARAARQMIHLFFI